MEMVYGITHRHTILRLKPAAAVPHILIKVVAWTGTTVYITSREMIFSSHDIRNSVVQRTACMKTYEVSVCRTRTVEMSGSFTIAVPDGWDIPRIEEMV